MVDDLIAMKSDKFRVLLTMVQHDSYRDQCLAVLDERKVPHFKANIRRYVAFQKAASSGVLVKDAEDERADRAWEGYQQLGTEIVRMYFRHDGRKAGRKEARTA